MCISIKISKCQLSWSLCVASKTKMSEKQNGNQAKLENANERIAYTLLFTFHSLFPKILATSPLAQLVGRPPGRLDDSYPCACSCKTSIQKNTKGRKEKKRIKNTHLFHTHPSPSHHQIQRSPRNSYWHVGSVSQRLKLL